MAVREIDPKLAVELEAAAFRRLVAHLRERADAQNIDLMNLAGFCRNCLSNWYRDAAIEKGIELSKDESRELIYGMPYEEWKALHQAEASRSNLGSSKPLIRITKRRGASAFWTLSAALAVCGITARRCVEPNLNPF